ncbi:MAG: PDZ domain-containing protein, partial [Verrucomicrobiota bacterium]
IVMQPISHEVAQFHGLEGQGEVVISDVIYKITAEKSGLMGKDIVVKLDGEPLPKLRPDLIIPRYLETQILRKQPTDTIKLSVIRGNEELELEVPMTEQPKSVKEADRKYYDELGLAIREFLLSDGIIRRELRTDAGGVVADFIKPNSRFSAAELRPGDWVKEIDGTKINSFAQAEQILDGVSSDQGKDELVLLVERNNETKVLRVKLK